MDLPAFRRFCRAIALSCRKGHHSWFFALCAWHKAMKLDTVPASGSADVTAILLSYRRPQNIDPIIRSLLHCPSIRRIIVSNNNPEIRLEQWLSIRDSRIEIMHQAVRCQTTFRFMIATREQSEFFLCIDDDIFLLPSQIESLWSELRKDPEVPHGIFGQVYDAKTRSMRYAIHSVTRRVDGLNRVYAFTQKHLNEFHRLAAALGLREGHSFWNRSLWDDLALSFTGSAKPMIHDLGRFLNCPTNADVSTAAMREPDFFPLRLHLFEELSKIKPLRDVSS